MGPWELWADILRARTIGGNLRRAMVQKLEGLRNLTGSLSPGWSNLEHEELPPIMILQGDQDRYWLSETRKRNWIRALIDTGKVDFVLFRGVSHGGMKNSTLRSYAKSFLISQLRD